MHFALRDALSAFEFAQRVIQAKSIAEFTKLLGAFVRAVHPPAPTWTLPADPRADKSSHRWGPGQLTPRKAKRRISRGLAVGVTTRTTFFSTIEMGNKGAEAMIRAIVTELVVAVQSQCWQSARLVF